MDSNTLQSYKSTPTVIDTATVLNCGAQMSHSKLTLAQLQCASAADVTNVALEVCYSMG